MDLTLVTFASKQTKFTTGIPELDPVPVKAP